jgi:hypothetical protein
MTAPPQHNHLTGNSPAGSYFKDLYEKSLPAAGEPFPLSGCVFGCIVSSGWFTDLQEKFGETFGWSG